MDTLHITHCDCRYRLPRSIADEGRKRLDHLWIDTLPAMLDAGLMRSGVAPYEEVCVQRVEAVARLRINQPDLRLGAEWSSVLIAAIERAIREGGSGIVRYRTRHAALVDVVVSATRGNLTRAWAWTQLGLWPEPQVVTSREVVAAIMNVLVTDARVAAAVLATAAQENATVLERLIELGTPEAWLRLATAALSAHGLSSALPPDQPMAGAASRAAHVARLLSRRSRIFAAARGSRRLEHVPEDVRHAVAALAVLEADPGVCAGGNAARIAPVIHACAAAVRGVESTRSEALPAALKRPASVPHEPTSVAALHVEVPDSRSAPRDAELPVRTAFGGLLFVHHLIRSLGIPEEITAGTAIGSHSIRWVLHALGCSMDEIPADDPAALAFAGLPPDARAPSEMEPPPDEGVRRAIDGWRDRITAALRVRLPDHTETDAALRRFISRRRAEIVVDAAWIELRFALDDVSTEIRRAGLDVDLGWTPWLGAVVRFVYE